MIIEQARLEVQDILCKAKLEKERIAKADQERIATPKEASKAGADFIVIGRPILEAGDPLKAVKEILCQKN